MSDKSTQVSKNMPLFHKRVPVSSREGYTEYWCHLQQLIPSLLTAVAKELDFSRRLNFFSAYFVGR